VTGQEISDVHRPLSLGLDFGQFQYPCTRGDAQLVSARSQDRLEELQKELTSPSEIEVCDLSQPEACKALYVRHRESGLDLLVNNAGFGVFGEFSTTDLDAELQMIDLNIKATHILTKLFLADFIKADHGTILNVASTAAFLPGPLLAAYYASKAYVLRLSEAISEELRQKGSRVSVSVLCPGPVQTAFNERAGAGPGLKGMDSRTVAAYALKMAARRKLIIIPGLMNRIAVAGQKLMSEKMQLRTIYAIQKLKRRI